jgi:photosystem II stability/assembly factor-like uncharacterized protein
MHAITFGDDQFVMVGHGAMTSPNGETWFAANTGTTQKLTDVVHDARSGRFIAVGEKGALLVSSDRGTSWTPRNAGTTVDLYDVALGDGFLVVAGAALNIDGMLMGALAFSTDGGDTWRLVRSRIPSGIDSIAVTW